MIPDACVASFIHTQVAVAIIDAAIDKNVGIDRTGCLLPRLPAYFVWLSSQG